MGKNPGYGHGTTTLVNLATHFKSPLVWVYPAKHPLKKERLDYTHETTYAIVSSVVATVSKTLDKGTRTLSPHLLLSYLILPRRNHY